MCGRIADRRVHLGIALEPLIGLVAIQGQVLGRDLDGGDVLVVGEEGDLLGRRDVQDVDAAADLARQADQTAGAT